MRHFNYKVNDNSAEKYLNLFAVLFGWMKRPLGAPSRALCTPSNNVNSFSTSSHSKCVPLKGTARRAFGSIHFYGSHFNFFASSFHFECVCWVELRAANILRVIQMRPEDLIPYYSMIHASQFALGLFIQRSERCSSL